MADSIQVTSGSVHTGSTIVDYIKNGVRRITHVRSGQTETTTPEGKKLTFNPAGKAELNKGRKQETNIAGSDTCNMGEVYETNHSTETIIAAHPNAMQPDEENPFKKWFDKVASYAAKRAQSPDCRGSYPGEMCGKATTKPETGTRIENPLMTEIKENKESGLTPFGNSIPLNQIVGSVIKCIGGIISFITGLVDDLISFVLGGIQMLTNLIVGAVESVISVITAPIQSALNDVTLGITNLLEAGANSFNITGQAEQAVREIAQSKFGCILSAFTGIGSFFKSLFTALGNALFKAIIGFVKAAINTIVNLVKNIILSIFGSILSIVNSIQSALKGLNDYIADSLQQLSPSSYGMC